jgi:hypothetical protein
MASNDPIESRPPRSVLVINPNGGGRGSTTDLDICIVTAAGEEIWWEQFADAPWEVVVAALREAWSAVSARSLTPGCIAYVATNGGTSNAAALCDELRNLGCATYTAAAGKPGVELPIALVYQYMNMREHFDHWVRAWAHHFADTVASR